MVEVYLLSLCVYAGATASVIIAYIMPSLTFIRLLSLNPELTGSGMVVSPGGTPRAPVVASEVRTYSCLLILSSLS
jgi:hypothetical protein